METKLNKVLASTIGWIFNRTGKKWRPGKEPTIGVSWEGFGELGASDTDDELFFYHGEVSYKVIPINGLKDHTVALMF